MSVRDEVRDLLAAAPDERLKDIRTYLEKLCEADAAWSQWEERYGGAATDEHIRVAVAEAETDPGASVAHGTVVAWMRSWGTNHELPPPLTGM